MSEQLKMFPEPDEFIRLEALYGRDASQSVKCSLPADAIRRLIKIYDEIKTNHKTPDEWRAANLMVDYLKRMLVKQGLKPELTDQNI